MRTQDDGYYEVHMSAMNRAEMLAAIIAAIQTDANLLTLVRASVTYNMQFQEDARMIVICGIVGIDPTTGGAGE